MAFRYSVRETGLTPGEATTRILAIRALTTFTVANLTTAGFSSDDASVLSEAALNTGSSTTTVLQDAILDAWLPENELFYNSVGGSLNIRRGNTVSTVAGTVISAPYASFSFTITNASQTNVPATFAENANSDLTDDSGINILDLGEASFTDVHLNGVKLRRGRDYLFETVTVGTTDTEGLRFVELAPAFRPGGATPLDTADYPVDVSDIVTHPDGITGQVATAVLYDDVPVVQGDIICVQSFNTVRPSVVNAANVIGDFQNSVLVNDGQSTLIIDGVSYISQPGSTNTITNIPDSSVDASKIDSSVFVSNKSHTIRKGATSISFTDQAMTWEEQSSNFVAVTNTGYFIDTSGGVLTSTLPNNPNTGDVIRFIDVTNSFSTSTFTVARAIANDTAHAIQGDTAADFSISTDRAAFGLIYTGSSNAWVLLEK